MKPIFEFHDAGRDYRIFADGRIEGGADLGLIVNRVAPLLHYAVTSAKQLGHQIMAKKLEEFQ